MSILIFSLRHGQMLTGLKKRIGGSFHRSRSRKTPNSKSLPSDVTDMGMPTTQELMNSEIRQKVEERERRMEENELAVKEGSATAAAAAAVSPRDSKLAPKILYHGCHQDAESLDSLSVSSVSEFSLTGVDDRGANSPVDGESIHSGTMDVLADRMYLYGGDFAGMSDSPIFKDVCKSLGKAKNNSLKTESRLDAVTQPPARPGSTVHEKETCFSSKKTTPTDDVAKQDLLPNEHSEGLLSLQEAQASSHSVVIQYNADSDTEDAGGEAATAAEGNLYVDVSGSSTLESDNQETFLPETLPLSLPADPEEIPIDLIAKRDTVSKAELTSDGGSTTSVNRSTHIPANCTSSGQDEVLIDSDEGSKRTTDSNECRPIHRTELSWSAISSSLKPVARKRSKSSSSCVRSKPKPLPRLFKKRKSCDEDRQKKEARFLSSLPADFKLAPLSRGCIGVRNGQGGGEEDRENTNGDCDTSTSINREVFAPQSTSGDRSGIFSTFGQSSNAGFSGKCISPDSTAKSDPKTSDPIPPPRRKRIQTASTNSSKEESEVVSPDHYSNGLCDTSNNGSYAMPPDKIQFDATMRCPNEITGNSGTKDLSSDSSSSLSSDKKSVQELPTDILFPEEDDMLGGPPLEGMDKLQLRVHLHSFKGLKVLDRNSQNSMSVFDGSNASNLDSGARLHSMVDDYGVSEQSGGLYSGGIAIPQQSNSNLEGASFFNFSSNQPINNSQPIQVVTPASSE